MDGFFQDNNKNISGLTTINADYISTSNLYINSTNIETSINDVITYENNNDINIDNLQNQINNITSTTTNGGGYFNIVCERVGYGTLNSPFSFGASCYNNNDILMPACILTGMRITANVAPTSGTTYYVLYKNNVAMSSPNSISLTTGQTSNQSLSYNNAFLAGDTFKILALNSGSFGTNNSTVQIRINCIFSTAGVKGIDGVSPSLTIGTTTTLAAGVNASVTNSGTTTNQILNFAIPQGVTGRPGLSIKGDTEWY